MQGRVDQVSGAMREQQEAAEQSAGSMEEINQLARSANDASREMDTATDQLATQADDLNKLAGSFEEGGESGSSITDAASNAELDG
jgi:methyl-accepting chemotaxis protein